MCKISQLQKYTNFKFNAKQKSQKGCVVMANLLRITSQGLPRGWISSKNIIQIQTSNWDQGMQLTQFKSSLFKTIACSDAISHFSEVMVVCTEGYYLTQAKIKSCNPKTESFTAGQWAHGMKNWSIIHINSLIYLQQLEIKDTFSFEIKGRKC